MAQAFLGRQLTFYLKVHTQSSTNSCLPRKILCFCHNQLIKTQWKSSHREEAGACHQASHQPPLLQGEQIRGPQLQVLAPRPFTIFCCPSLHANIFTSFLHCAAQALSSAVYMSQTSSLNFCSCKGLLIVRERRISHHRYLTIKRLWLELFRKGADYNVLVSFWLLLSSCRVHFRKFSQQNWKYFIIFPSFYIPCFD